MMARTGLPLAAWPRGSAGRLAVTLSKLLAESVTRFRRREPPCEAFLEEGACSGSSCTSSGEAAAVEASGAATTFSWTGRQMSERAATTPWVGVGAGVGVGVRLVLAWAEERVGGVTEAGSAAVAEALAGAARLLEVLLGRVLLVLHLVRGAGLGLGLGMGLGTGLGWGLK